jgi:hypothetical protein
LLGRKRTEVPDLGRCASARTDPSGRENRLDQKDGESQERGGGWKQPSVPA